MTDFSNRRLRNLQQVYGRAQRGPRDLDTLIRVMDRHKQRIGALPHVQQVPAWQTAIRDLSDAELQLLVDAGG